MNPEDGDGKSLATLNSADEVPYLGTLGSRQQRRILGRARTIERTEGIAVTEDVLEAGNALALEAQAAMKRSSHHGQCLCHPPVDSV